MSRSKFYFILFSVFMLLAVNVFSQDVTDDVTDETAEEIENEATDQSNEEETTMQNNSEPTNNPADPFYKRVAEKYESDNSTFVNSDCYFKLDSNDEGTGLNRIEYSIDSSDFRLYSNPFNLIEEGARIIKYRGVDNGDNYEKAKILQVIVDNTAPVSKIQTDREVYIDGFRKYCSTKTRFMIIATDDSGASGSKMTFGGFSVNEMSEQGNGEYNEENFFTMGEEGAKEFYYTSVDNVGNRENVNKYSIIVDGTPPVVSIAQNDNLVVKNNEYVVIPSAEMQTEDGQYIITSKHVVGFDAVDELSGVAAIYVKINDQDFVKYNGAIQFEKAPSYTILAKAEDNVGNVSEPVEFKFSLDFSNPDSMINVIDKEGNTVE